MSVVPREEPGSLAEEALIMHSLCVRWSVDELDALPTVTTSPMHGDLKVDGRTIRVWLRRRAGGADSVQVHRWRDGDWECVEIYGPAPTGPQVVDPAVLVAALDDLELPLPDPDDVVVEPVDDVDGICPDGYR